MDKLIKFFPFMPAEKDVGKLILAIAFYILGVSVVSFIVCTIMAITIILLPIAPIISFVFFAYSIAGAIFAIMSYCGHDFAKTENMEE